MPTTLVDLQIRPIHGLGHWRAVRQMLRDYAPGTDALMDQFRAMRFPLGPFARNVAGPLYFAREQGCLVRGPHGEMAAIMYLRRQAREGVRVLHIDDINVSAAHRRQGLAQRLLAYAEEVARRERFPYVKLAVTVTNTPAVTLYRRLGFQDQHHRHFNADAQALAALAAPVSDALRLRPVARAAATARSRDLFRVERDADTPETAPVMVPYYAPRVRRGALWMETIAWDGQDAGYWDARRSGGGLAVMLGLRPDLWGGEVERDVLHVLAERAGRLRGSRIRLHLMSAGHHRALSDGAPSLASAFGLVEQSDEGMLMVRVLPAS